MDRRLILAVAGSGKTTYLINTLNMEQRFLIVTYTDNNLANIRQRIINTFWVCSSKYDAYVIFSILNTCMLSPFSQE